MAITSLIITRKTLQIWCFTDNTMGEADQPRVARGALGYQGIGDENNNITITTQTGGILYQNVPATVIAYVDELDPDNNFPASNGNTALAVITHLEDNDFFGDSNGGGVPTIAFINLSDVTPQTYLGNQGKFIRVKADGTGVEFVDGGASLNQNNIGRIISQPLNLLAGQPIPDITIQWLRTKINQRTSPIVITEIETPVHFVVNKPVSGGVEKYVFLFKKGKGTWGAQFSNPSGLVGNDDFFLYPVVPVPAASIIDDPTTQTVNYTLDPGQDVSEWLNEQNPSIVLQSQDDGYVVFKSGSTTYLWISDGGTYGEFDQQSTMDDFQLLDANAPAPGTPTLQQTTDAGNTTDNDIIVENEKSVWVMPGPASAGGGAKIKFVDVLEILSPNEVDRPYSGLLNEKYIVRSIGGVPADSTGNVGGLFANKTVYYTAIATGDSATIPDLIGVDVFAISGNGGHYDINALTSAAPDGYGMVQDVETGEISFTAEFFIENNGYIIFIK